MCVLVWKMRNDNEIKMLLASVCVLLVGLEIKFPLSDHLLWRLIGQQRADHSSYQRANLKQFRR